MNLALYASKARSPRRLARTLLVISVLQCSCDDKELLPGGQLSPVAYLGLEDGASWVYRDDGERDEPVPERLLQARLMDEGMVELRRGVRWADAQEEGWLQWGVEEGIWLESWSLFGFSGDEPLQLASTSQANGDSVSQEGWQCTLEVPLEVETFYATYEDPLLLDCQGDKGIPGRYYFAENFGLILLEGADFTLDIVAPW